MIEKEYYRLEELKERFHLTESDVRYMIERKLVKACFSIRKTKFVVDGWQEENRIGYAHINYQGLIALPDAEVGALLANGKITPLNYLLSRDGTIELVETDYPLGIAKPKTFEEAWKPKSASSRNEEFLEARLSPFVSKTVWHSYENARKEVNYSRELFPKNEECEIRLAISKKLDLPLSFNKLLFSDICIRHSDLLSVNSNFSGKQQKRVASDLNQAHIDLDRNAFDNLILRILKSDRTYTAKSIFKVLAHESSLEEDARQFDIENILLDHIDDIIIWKDFLSKSPEKRCSLATLGNKLTNIRKTLNTKD